MHILGPLLVHTDDNMAIVCDYTGRNASWVPGPLTYSAEAIYPFTVVKGDIFYYPPPNVCYTTCVLNWVKAKQPILVLRLLDYYKFTRTRVSSLERLCGAGRIIMCHEPAFLLESVTKRQVDKWELESKKAEGT